jgi:hypothetical protein
MLLLYWSGSATGWVSTAAEQHGLLVLPAMRCSLRADVVLLRKHCVLGSLLLIHAHSDTTGSCTAVQVLKLKQLLTRVGFSDHCTDKSRSKSKGTAAVSAEAIR